MKVKLFLKASGRSPIEDFLKGCSEGVRADFFDAIALLGAGRTLSMPISRSLSSIYAGLHELRLKDRTGQYRFFYYVKRADGIYVVHCFKKKTQELPKQEVAVVLKRIKEI